MGRGDLISRSSSPCRCSDAEKAEAVSLDTLSETNRDRRIVVVALSCTPLLKGNLNETNGFGVTAGVSIPSCDGRGIWRPTQKNANATRSAMSKSIMMERNDTSFKAHAEVKNIPRNAKGLFSIMLPS
mmetsp:Transcript_29548/g.33738  ORF Transcript_29548/g.33738 Transcript_29548/m.33738 type:complete len:128 (-) Transcript_29548:401-784(-)